MAKKYRVERDGAAASPPFLLARKGPASGGERAVLHKPDGKIIIAKRGPAAGNDR